MFCSRAVFVLAAVLLAFSSFTSEAELKLANGSTNLLFVSTVAGPCVVPGGTSLTWPIDSVSTNYFGTNVPGSYSFVTNGFFVGEPGHDYDITMPLLGPVAVIDSAVTQSGWFWSGLTMSLGAGLLALGARWVRILLAGGDSMGAD